MKTAYQKVIAKWDLRCNLNWPSLYRVLVPLKVSDMNEISMFFALKVDYYYFLFLWIFLSPMFARLCFGKSILNFSSSKNNCTLKNNRFYICKSLVISWEVVKLAFHIQYVNIIYFIKSDWGWNEGNKKAELFEEAAWWVLILFLTILKHSDKQYLQVLDCAEWWWNSHCLFPLQVKYEDSCSNVMEEKLVVDDYY